MKLKLNGSEGDLTSASSVSLARLVRVYNSGGSDLLLTQKNSSGTTIGTVTVKTKEVVFIKKEGLDTLEGGAALKVVNINFA
tara:strand:- start:1991 stop:2236 length:246 start_codon:yes stop_codon:yes gene_type:complete